MTSGTQHPSDHRPTCRVTNVALHLLHLSVIGFCLTGWAFEATRVTHLVLCGITLASWFVLGPLLGRPGFCFLTGIQHKLWARDGRVDQPSYMSYLVERISGRPPGVRGTRAIEWTTQLALYTCTLLSLYLLN